MAATRRNIIDNPGDAQAFITAVTRLKAEPSGRSTADLGIAPGRNGGHSMLSTWDLFVIWHVVAMNEMSSDGRRNAAHSGPVFLPWHRWYMLVLEFHMRRVLEVDDDAFGIPYWDWAADGSAFSAARQRTALPLWSIVGGNGTGPFREVTSGPFSTAAGFRINVEEAPDNRLRAANRPLRRNFGEARDQFGRRLAPSLPTKGHEARLSNFDVYDEAPWAPLTGTFRDELEGWTGAVAPGMHNRVHVWIGGDMGPATSPNDPLFFLNHCNVDRLWEEWQTAQPGRGYVPAGVSTPTSPLFRHRLGDPLQSLFTTNEPPVGAMSDVSQFYVYG